jgi:hypothetical protein
LLAFFFGAPLTAFGVAAGAVSIPIIIHLLNRKRFRVVTWAAMRFLLAAQRKNSRRLRLEQLILLAVRTLVVLLLVAAMASVMPWAEDLWRRWFPDSVALAAPGSLRTHKIIVLDGSMSMGLKLGDVDCFGKAKAVAAQMVRASSSGDAFSVVLMAAPPRRVVPGAAEDAHKVATEIEALRLPHGNADLAATLNTVEDLVKQSPGKFDEREVYFFTDLQQFTWLSRQGSLTEALQSIQAKSRTVLVDVGQDGANNVAVTDLTLGAPLATTSSVLPITATIHNYGAEPRDSVRVELWLGRARDHATDAPLEMRLASQTSVKLARGQNAVSFPYRFSVPGDYVVQVRIENDALDLDDVRSAVVTVKNSVPVMLVNGKPSADAFDRATEWLRLALNPFESGPAFGVVPAKPKVLSEVQFADAGLGDLTEYDCVYLCDVTRLGMPEIRRLETHVRRGGGVVVSLGDHIDFAAYNELLFKNGVGLLPARLLAKQKAPADAYYHFAVDGQAYRLPPLDAFTDDNDRTSLLTARFRQYVRTELAAKGQPRKILTFMPASSSVKAAPGNRRELEGLPLGDAAVVEWNPPLAVAVNERGAKSPARARGRVVLIPTTLNMDWTSWPASRSYVPLMQELLQYAVAGRLREQAVTVGEPLEEFLQASGVGLDVSLRLPDGKTETTQTQAQDESSFFRWTDSERSGLYRATIGQHPREHWFAVNVPTTSDAQQACESDLTRTSKEELRKAYPEWDFQLVRELGDVVHGSGSGTGDLRSRPLGGVVARFLLLAMLALLLVEAVLAWRFGHYSAVAGAPGGPPARGKLLPGFALVFAGAAVIVIAGVLGHAVWTGDFLGFLPESVRRGFEDRMGIPPPATGEGTHWRLEFAPYFWDAATDVWLAGFVAIASVSLVGWVCLQEGTTASKAYKLLIAGLRICIVLLTLAVLLPQLRLWFERQSWPDIAIVIDDSQSMSSADRYRDPEVQAAATKLAALGQLSSQERLQLAQALLTRSQPDWLSRLLLDHKAKVHVYHCSLRAARIADIDGPEQIDAALESVRDLRADPTHDASQLGAAVRQVLSDFRGSSLSAVIMLTDGVTTEGEDLVKVARHASQVGVPLFFVGIGDDHEARDVEVHDLQVEDSVYVNDKLIFEVRLTGHGYDDLSVPVRLREKGKDKVLDTQVVKVDPQGRPVKVRLVDQPKEPGEKTYVIDVLPQLEEVKLDNNALERSVLVRETKLTKVLYVEGYARYDFRFLKTLLERESTRTKGNKSIDLRVLLVDADPDYAVEDKSALADFPTKAELNQFDVVILGDVDPKADPKMMDHLKDLAEFVKERGGGLLMIAGERYAPHTYKGTPLADVLPIEIVADRQPDEPEAGRTVGYRPELTPIGRLHPIFRFSPDEKDSLDIWDRLRELYWWSEGYTPKRAAEILAVRPRGGAGPNADGAGLGQPLAVQQFVGAGRCMFFGFNESWRWRFREQELHYNQFWIQTIRYLARSRLGRVDLRLDRQTPYRRGEPIKMTVRFPDDSPPPGPETEVRVMVERKLPRSADTEVQTVQLAKAEGSRATYEGLLTRTPEGEYRFALSSPTVTGSKPHAACKVLAPPGEMELLRMNQPDMERAAEESHGKFYTLAEADRLLDQLPSGTRVTLNAPGPPWLLWNHSAMFGLAMMLLLLEWVLRKRKHLL